MTAQAFNARNNGFSQVASIKFYPRCAYTASLLLYAKYCKTHVVALAVHIAVLIEAAAAVALRVKLT